MNEYDTTQFSPMTKAVSGSSIQNLGWGFANRFNRVVTLEKLSVFTNFSKSKLPNNFSRLFRSLVGLTGQVIVIKFPSAM